MGNLGVQMGLGLILLVAGTPGVVLLVLAFGLTWLARLVATVLLGLAGAVFALEFVDWYVRWSIRRQIRAEDRALTHPTDPTHPSPDAP